MAYQYIVARVGFWSGMTAFLFTIAYCIVQLLQIAGILKYPIDAILIFATSLCIVIPFVLEILAMHYLTSFTRKFWSHAALVFTILYAVFVTANYVVQLATVIPSTLSGHGDTIAILDQTPHSMFWNFDALGYIFMGLTTLVAIPAFTNTGFHKWVRGAFLANALVTPLISIVYFYPNFSTDLLILGYPWAITAPLSMLLLAINFRRDFLNKNERGEVLIKSAVQP